MNNNGNGSRPASPTARYLLDVAQCAVSGDGDEAKVLLETYLDGLALLHTIANTQPVSLDMYHVVKRYVTTDPRLFIMIGESDGYSRS